MTPSHRDTIFVEDAEILIHQHWPDNQHILRLSAIKCSHQAVAGQFVHLQCDRCLALRRPLSILRSSPAEGWIELLYKVVGYGTALLAKRQAGETLNLLGPIGNAFTPDPQRPHRLLIGGGVGIPPMLFLAEQLASQMPDHTQHTLVLMGSESAFPFDLATSKTTIQGINDACNLSLPATEKLGISSRLASMNQLHGCYQGYVTDLAEKFLHAMDPSLLKQVEIFACGPHPMLISVRKLAESFAVPCQISLEEYMACAVGGCAGCVVKVFTETGDAMQRVCVDGPVFDAKTVAL